MDSFLWAVATVRSRIHSPLDGDYVALVPLADLVRILLASEWHCSSRLPHITYMGVV